MLKNESRELTYSFGVHLCIIKAVILLSVKSFLSKNKFFVLFLLLTRRDDSMDRRRMQKF